jgi:hypothetical protein
MAMAMAAAAAGCVAADGDVLVHVGGDGGAPDTPDASLARDAAASCDAPGPCPPPAPGDITVCGRVIDLETSAPVTDPRLAVNIFNFLDITTGPPGANPIATVQADACGWFVAEQIDAVLPGLLVLATDDDTLFGGPYRRVASVIPSSTGQLIRSSAFALRATTDAAWTASAGLSGGFADRGALLPIFIDITRPAVGPFQGAPVSGVAVAGSGGPTVRYFADASPLSRTAIAAGASATGINGSAIALDALLSTAYTGTKPGCSFAEAVGITVANVVQAQEILGTCE